jgi:hypothetical protein
MYIIIVVVLIAPKVGTLLYRKIEIKELIKLWKSKKRLFKCCFKAPMLVVEAL